MENVDIETFMQRLDEISTRRKAMQSKLAREKHRVDELVAERRKRIEERRRKGDNGRAWQVLQQRIDMGETCESDIFSGIDKSPEAREVRGYTSKLAGYMRDYVEDADDQDNEAAQGRVKLDEQMKHLHELESRLNAQA
ncbi:hypothetical protein [Bifidobacterium moukalabense]|uniref:Uncharacterized protein n=2 Tax=Bifidobacterium moukalabense TaxID=1333651 RepID=W4NCR8_9BIFI|nr:hypothetical protein [Bifidobacterium moukalabense]ETY72286.1 hypothetical protein BMOU_0303 [Bifidobacterium moukalabense DSM 27321]